MNKFILVFILFASSFEISAQILCNSSSLYADADSGRFESGDAASWGYSPTLVTYSKSSAIKRTGNFSLVLRGDAEITGYARYITKSSFVAKVDKRYVLDGYVYVEDLANSSIPDHTLVTIQFPPNENLLIRPADVPYYIPNSSNRNAWNKVISRPLVVSTETVIPVIYAFDVNSLRPENDADDFGTVYYDDVKIIELCPVSIISEQMTPATSMNSNDGKFVIKLKGGTAPYHYLRSWDNHIVDVSSDSIVISDLPKGDYSISITDDYLSTTYSGETFEQAKRGGYAHSINFSITSFQPHELVADYNFNNNGNDDSGNGIHGEILGASPDLDRFKVQSRAYKFDGIDDGFDVPNHPLLNHSKGTWSVWLKIPQASFGNGNIIMSKGGFGQPYMGLYENGGEIGAEVSFLGNVGAAEGNYQLRSTKFVADGKYHNISLTYDEDAVALYIDGKLSKSLPVSFIFSGNSLPLRIAKPESYWQYFNGTIDEVKIYKYALTSSEVANIYDQFEIPILGPEKPIVKLLSHARSLDEKMYYVNVQSQDIDEYEVFTPTGVRTLRGKNSNIGNSILHLEAANLSAGTYILRLISVGGQTRLLKIIKE